VSDVTDVAWAAIVGQAGAIEQLRRAAPRPVHAYLLVGSPGSGAEDAARCFAAAVVAGDDDQRAWDLARRGVHPDVIEIDPEANQIRVEDAQAIIDEASRSPIEGARKVILVLEAERLNDAAANKLLKTLEEPPDAVVLVLVTAGADQLLATIRSRCQRVDFASLGQATVADALIAEGVDTARASALARIAGGRLDRARALAGAFGAVRVAFVDAAESLDGTGAAVARQSEALQAVLGAVVAELVARQGAELEQLDGELEAAGFPARVARAQRRRLEERHKRSLRRVRTDALIEGITALETVYRDALVGDVALRLDADSASVAAAPRACLDALDACRQARQTLVEHNPNDALLLERLLLALPDAGTDADADADASSSRVREHRRSP
jgi:DNA polymerase-3 subunit delta'